MIIATHNGTFHADETTACAILTYLFENSSIIRSRDPEELEKADIIIDVREPAEYAAGHIKGAISVPRGILEFRISDLPAIKGADTEILLYCQSSGRAALAAQSLAELGYTQVASIAGGYEACLETDIPITMANEGINFY